VLALSLLLSSLTASAQDVDCRALSRELTDANPSQVGALFVKITESCPGNFINRAVGDTLSRAIPNDGGRAAAVAAVQRGYGAQATVWINSLQTDDRAKVLRDLGEACDDSLPIQDYFIGNAKSMGDSFWNDRWYRALSACSAVPIQDLLWAELGQGLGEDRARFFGVLEAYARSAGSLAVPKLVELAKRTNNPEAQVNIVNAFSDAAQVGSVEGLNQATATRATRAITGLAPTLSQKAVEQARITLIALGSELESDELAAIRYSDLKQDDGYIWGAVVSETASCKGGKRIMQRMHWARVVDQGSTWADQALDKVQSSAEVVWTLDLATRCRGEEELSYHVSSLPFASDDELKAWAVEQMDELTNPGAKKVFRVEEDPLNL
jgi:hypothetical protein